MRHSIAAACVALLVVASGAASAGAAPLPPAKNVWSVWTLGIQPCNGGGANAFTRHPGEREVRARRRLELPGLGYALAIPQVQAVADTVVKVHLDDHGRGVTDHYLLLADDDLSPPFGAVVITELPPGLREREDVFEATRSVEQALAERSGVSPQFTRLDGPYGPALEMLVPGRVGSHCFPTSDFVLQPAASDASTIGITRFVVDGARLLEFSLIVRVSKHARPARQQSYARALMDGFWQSLEPTPGAAQSASPKGASIP